MATLFLSRPLTKPEMEKILSGIPEKERTKLNIKFWLDHEDERDKNAQIRISSNDKLHVALVKQQLVHIKGVKLI